MKAETKRAVALILLVCHWGTLLHSQAPDWWAARQARNPVLAPDDYALINQGQLKHLAHAAYLEMEERLPGGAGPQITALVQSWLTPGAAGRDDYAVANLGQLKAVSALFHSRLQQEGVSVPHTWSAATTDDDDFAPANIGQAKALFAFSIPEGMVGGGGTTGGTGGTTGGTGGTGGTTGTGGTGGNTGSSIFDSTHAPFQVGFQSWRGGRVASISMDQNPGVVPETKTEHKGIVNRWTWHFPPGGTSMPVKTYMEGSQQTFDPISSDNPEQWKMNHTDPPVDYLHKEVEMESYYDPSDETGMTVHGTLHYRIQIIDGTDHTPKGEKEPEIIMSYSDWYGAVQADTHRLYLESIGQHSMIAEDPDGPGSWREADCWPKGEDTDYWEIDGENEDLAEDHYYKDWAGHTARGPDDWSPQPEETTQAPEPRLQQLGQTIPMLAWRLESGGGWVATAEASLRKSDENVQTGDGVIQRRTDRYSGQHSRGTVVIEWDGDYPVELDEAQREQWLKRYLVRIVRTTQDGDDPEDTETIIQPLSDYLSTSSSQATIPLEPGAVEEGKSKRVTLSFLTAELRDIKDHANAGDDVTITNWDTTQTITDNNIAWIEAHTSTTNAAPRMPQLELRIPGLGQGMTIEAKLEVRYDRGNGQRTARNQPEDTVRIPANGNFAQVNGDTWNLYSEADWQTELTQDGFFGGEATLTCRLMNGQNQVLAPQTIRFRIGGRNPEPARARQFIETLNNAGPQGPLWFAYAIAKSETRDRNNNGTRYNHFWQLSGAANDNYHQTRTVDAGRPVWGNDGGTTPGGYGLFQVTGNAQSELANIPRQQIWNWQENARAGLAILETKRTSADNWMTQQKNANNANGVALPSLTVRNVTFAEGTNRTMNNAVTMKAWNGASRAPTGFTDPDDPAAGFIIDPQSSGNFCYWKNSASGTNKWALSRYNDPPGNIQPFNYVDRVCQEVE